MVDSGVTLEVAPLSHVGGLRTPEGETVPRTMVEVITDDFTGQQHEASEVEDVILRFGYEEWKLVLTSASRQKIREMFDPFTVNVPCKDTTPSWAKVQPSTTAGGSTSTPQPAVTVVPPDNTMVRRWWADLTPANLRSLKLDAPKSNRGKIPEDVIAAFVEAHQAPTPAFSG